MVASSGIRLVIGVSAVSIFLSACQTIPFFKSITIQKESGSMSLFEGPVKSVLEHRCIHCHNDKLINGGLNLQDRDLVFKGDAKGPFIIPGQPDKSRIWNVIILPAKHAHAMPADGWGLNTDELRSFLTWIERGADWPTGPDGELTIRNYEVALNDTL